MGLCLLMVFLLGLGGLGTLGFVLKKKMTLSSHCVHSVLMLQKDLRRPLTRLLALNKQASSLRLREKKARFQLKAALATGVPPVIAAAKARLLLITAKQLVLRAKQESLLMEARLRREQFHHLVLKNSAKAERHTGFPGESSGLAVQARPPTSLSPDYEPTADFRERQGQTYFITQKFSLPALGFEAFFPWEDPLRIKESCSATLQRKGDRQWMPVLKTVKVSWRFLYGSL